MGLLPEGLALLGMVLIVAGNYLILTTFGFSTLVSPVIGRLYLEGQPGAMEVNELPFVAFAAFARAMERFFIVKQRSSARSTFSSTRSRA